MCAADRGRGAEDVGTSGELEVERADAVRGDRGARGGQGQDGRGEGQGVWCRVRLDRCRAPCLRLSSLRFTVTDPMTLSYTRSNPYAERVAVLSTSRARHETLSFVGRPPPEGPPSTRMRKRKPFRPVYAH